MSEVVKKYCIFHVPNYIDQSGKSGSQVRPRKMIQAFKNIGYDVDVVLGYAEERKNCIEKIEKKIKQGKKYDFLYSESSTMPTLLTEKNHIPKYFGIDFKFFKFCKKNGISIGLFYRDIYWKFPVYKKNVKGLKYYLAQWAYKYDLRHYNSLLDVMYVSNSRVLNYLDKNVNYKYDVLFPAGEFDENYINEKNSAYKTIENNSKINMFYVGGIGGQYNFSKFLKIVKSLNFIDLTICCRENDWNENKLYYEKFLSGNIKVVHESGKNLEKYYKNAMICVALFELDEYMNMAMPIKIFEYLGHLTPIISTKGTAAGDFVEKEDIGWNIKYNQKEIVDLLNYLNENRLDIVKKHKNMIEVIGNHTWDNRALKVQGDLTHSFSSNK